MDRRAQRGAGREHIDGKEHAGFENHMSIVEFARSGNLAMVEKLLERDADAALKMDTKGWTAGHYAALLGHIDILKRLYAANAAVLCIPAAKGAGKYPAHMAVEHDEQAVLKWISSVDPALLSAPDKMGKSAIMMVAEKRCRGSTQSAHEWLGLGADVRILSQSNPLFVISVFCIFVWTSTQDFSFFPGLTRLSGVHREDSQSNLQPPAQSI